MIFQVAASPDGISLLSSEAHTGLEGGVRVGVGVVGPMNSEREPVGDCGEPGVDGGCESGMLALRVVGYLEGSENERGAGACLECANCGGEGVRYTWWCR